MEPCAIAKTALEVLKKLYELGKRVLREKPRLKREEYVFCNPFYYRKDRPQQPLCVKCFENDREGPMAEPGVNVTPSYRQCLLCGNIVEVVTAGEGRSGC